MSDLTPAATVAPEARLAVGELRGFVRRNPTVAMGSILLLAIVLVAVLASWIAPGDPQELHPALRLRPPSGEFWFGTDMYGRDVFTRTIHGSQISLLVGALVAVISIGFGLVIGLISGYV